MYDSDIDRTAGGHGCRQKHMLSWFPPGARAGLLLMSRPATHCAPSCPPAGRLHLPAMRHHRVLQVPAQQLPGTLFADRQPMEADGPLSACAPEMSTEMAGRVLQAPVVLSPAPHPACSRSRGSLYDVLRGARTSPEKAAQLTWSRRLNMVGAGWAARGAPSWHCWNTPTLHATRLPARCSHCSALMGNIGTRVLWQALRLQDVCQQTCGMQGTP